MKKLEGKGNLVAGFWVGGKIIKDVKGYEPAKILLNNGEWVEVHLFKYKDAIDIEDRITNGLRIYNEIAERER